MLISGLIQKAKIWLEGILKINIIWKWTAEILVFLWTIKKPG